MSNRRNINTNDVTSHNLHYSFMIQDIQVLTILTNLFR